MIKNTNLIDPPKCAYTPGINYGGLLRITDNSFYILDLESNIEMLKTIQFLLVKYEDFVFVNLSKHFSYADKVEAFADSCSSIYVKEFIKQMSQRLKFSVPENYEQEKELIKKTINNTNCSLVGLSSTALNHHVVGQDVKLGNLSFHIIKRDDQSKQFDTELQQKIYLLRSILSLTDEYCKFNEFLYNHNYGDIIAGLNQFNNFLELSKQANADLTTILLEERDDLKTEQQIILKKAKSDLIFFLNQLNYKNPIQDIVSELLSQIDSVLVDNSNGTVFHLVFVLKSFLREIV